MGRAIVVNGRTSGFGTIALGWPHERVQVIDEDLGKSGVGSVERYGFQKLIAEIGLGNAGLVVSLHHHLVQVPPSAHRCIADPPTAAGIKMTVR